MSNEGRRSKSKRADGQERESRREREKQQQREGRRELRRVANEILNCRRRVMSGAATAAAAVEAQTGQPKAGSRQQACNCQLDAQTAAAQQQPMCSFNPHSATKESKKAGGVDAE